METQKRAAATATTPCRCTGAKVLTSCETAKDLLKILEYFKYKVGTSLDAAKATGILRNSVTWYVDYLEREGLLQAICKRPDKTTGYLAKHYSADPQKWARKRNYQPLNLFGEDML